MDKLPPPFSSTTSEDTVLISQGAEALIFRTPFLDTLAALKVRSPKKWRHPTLDMRLTRSRVLAEMRVLVKLAGGVQMGAKGKKNPGPTVPKVRVPVVLGADWESGWLALEWIPGKSLKQTLWDVHPAEKERRVEELLRQLGVLVGRLHAAGVIHGDLTSSNVMVSEDPHSALEPAKADELVLIDFGLATNSVQDEDRAVDLYVLERAFGSTHPLLEYRFQTVLDEYVAVLGSNAKSVLRKLADVRMRGRKKTMIG
ncbi:kinase-like protein [Piedraia hortae CBS 480.64]|uniref:EKC/KEOPS complex subunit BUD32 n=1 Tax=Piedraia hortae CBS 480.64 TaxID=1314780 RepID=A0A6A7BT94_9PEZI|nr:kinase-like protein [Piedraia hortae CBS 480.64]